MLGNQSAVWALTLRCEGREAVSPDVVVFRGWHSTGRSCGHTWRSTLSAAASFHSAKWDTPLI